MGRLFMILVRRWGRLVGRIEYWFGLRRIWGLSRYFIKDLRCWRVIIGRFVLILWIRLRLLIVINWIRLRRVFVDRGISLLSSLSKISSRINRSFCRTSRLWCRSMRSNRSCWKYRKIIWSRKKKNSNNRL